MLERRNWPRRRFGRLGWSVRPLGLGGAWLRPDDPDRGLAVVLEAVNAGLDYLDTAPLYGPSEEVIGAALAELPAGRRPRLATKAGVVPRGEFEYTADWMLRSAERSLTRLSVERVELLQIHEVEQAGWERIMGPGGCLDGLRACQQRGWCEGIGVTGRDLALLTRLVQSGEFDAVLTYYEYDLLTAAAARELLPAAAARDVAVVLASPQRMGLFCRPDADWHRQPPKVAARRPALERLLGRPAHQLGGEALRYLLGDPRAAVVLVGCATADEWRQATERAAAGPLPLQQAAAIRALSE